MLYTKKERVMIFLTLFVIGLLMFLVGRRMAVVDRGTCHDWSKLWATGVFIMVVISIVWVGTSWAMMDVGPGMHAEYLRWETTKSYLYAETPKLPVPAQDNLPSGTAVNVDLVNKDVAEKLVDVRLTYYEHVQNYNTTLLWWRRYPRWAFWLALGPNPSDQMKDLSLVELPVMN
jgi:hypothetical protein